MRKILLSGFYGTALREGGTIMELHGGTVVELFKEKLTLMSTQIDIFNEALNLLPACK